MFAFRKSATAKPAEPVEQVDLETLSSETGVPVEMLRTLAGISDPANEHRFTAESARQAFAGVKARHAHA